MFEPATFASPAEPPRRQTDQPSATPRLIRPEPGRESDRWAGLQPPRATGLTGRGVIALILIATLLGGLLDMAISGHRGHLFGVFFMIASGVGALVVRRRDLSTAMVAPPLLYCVMIVVISFIDRSDVSGGFASRELFYVGKAFVTGAPSIWIGTALAVALGLLRKRAAASR